MTGWIVYGTHGNLICMMHRKWIGVHLSRWRAILRTSFHSFGFAASISIVTVRHTKEWAICMHARNNNHTETCDPRKITDPIRQLILIPV